MLKFCKGLEVEDLEDAMTIVVNYADGYTVIATRNGREWTWLDFGHDNWNPNPGEGSHWEQGNPKTLGHTAEELQEKDKNGEAGLSRDRTEGVIEELKDVDSERITLVTEDGVPYKPLKVYRQREKEGRKACPYRYEDAEEA